MDCIICTDSENTVRIKHKEDSNCCLYAHKKCINQYKKKECPLCRGELEIKHKLGLSKNLVKVILFIIGDFFVLLRFIAIPYIIPFLSFENTSVPVILYPTAIVSSVINFSVLTYWFMKRKIWIVFYSALSIISFIIYIAKANVIHEKTNSDFISYTIIFNTNFLLEILVLSATIIIIYLYVLLRTATHYKVYSTIENRDCLLSDI